MLQYQEIYTTEISVYEVITGFYYLKKNPEKFLEFLNTIKIIPSTSLYSVQAGEIAAVLYNKGKMVDHSDCLIAGMMKRFGIEKIITRNKKHFSEIPGITVITY